jgi:iron-sulfur cluster repair protein YtfE (RIC family)
MTEHPAPTEPLRAEHRELLPRLLALNTAADQLDGWDTDKALQMLSGIVAFLIDHLVPHARAEEEVLYPAVEEAMAAPGATATMQADHAEIVARVVQLERTIDTVAQHWPDRHLARNLGHQFVGLAAILQLHFDKEEQVLLPVLDDALTPEQADDLFARMGRVAHA